jgi:hypothetical protein
MATIEEVGEKAVAQLRKRLDDLHSAVEDDAADFTEVAAYADALGEAASTVAEIYREVEQLLTGRTAEDAAGARGHEAEQSGQREESSGSADATGEAATKEELLDRARELDVEGRSSMTKDELAEAVKSEESLTKEELLERAREAGIEGRSSMTKDELRVALHAAGA